MASPNVNDNDNTSAIPTFLANDPNPHSSANDGRPMTASSTGTSEFGANKQENRLSATGPVGEPGLPPARPTSDATGTSSWQRMSGSRASASVGGGPPPSQRSYRPFSRREGDTSRPGSGMSGPTHVPSLTAQGFFRPMSSQKLQAQRGQTVAPPSSSQGGHRIQQGVDEESEERKGHQHRYSNASVNTAREAAIASRDGEAPPLPVSRGFSVATSSGGAPLMAGGPGSTASKNSTTPLHTRQNTNEKLQTIDSKPKSPRSLRNSLGWGSNKSKRDVNEQRPSVKDHEKLSSVPASPNLRAKEKPASPARLSPGPTTSKPGRNYQYYAGNYLFFCFGRCLNTKANPLNIATFVLTVLPAALFFAFSAPWLWQNVSPALPIVFAYIFFVTFSAFIHAAISDPGVLPRNLHPHPPNSDEDRDPLTVGPPTTEWVMVKTFPSKQMTANLEAHAAETGSAGPSGATTAMEVPTKYCKTCNIWRPPRAHHCRVCDACIETQDHHCVWLNNCVGRRNYRYFFAYIGFGSIMALLLIAFSLTHVGMYASQNDMSFGSALSGRTEERVAFAMFIYAVLALPYPGSLFGYHLFLIARGETTREYLNSHKFLPKDRHRPFSQSSILKNWAAVLGRPRPPSYMSFKKAYQHGDVRMGHVLPKSERTEVAKLDAARSQSRVEGLKKRFSVPRGRGEGQQANGGAEREIEMKELPPPPQTADSGIGAQSTKSQKRALPGGANSTPR
ncbi:Putative palmitoyltransferase, DHHC domain-containing protein [Septoria linicola]|uniref:Palmitoyltransferase n=1 Tax=Septoria linicola TaxID=215465 RepID=A0A9Q9ATT3_9PEZI|nr:putative palmitoyltransferase, DHHC domain-containing protein [Septoria linicola]USW50606.1 Putative palmitoyltransferase, DHHC domain-containing protein [Septoria linicola]